MVAILEKSEHNVDFHPIVDFVEVSPLRRNLKIQDEEGISSLPDAELFENLTLMGYNISPNQKFTFQKGSSTPIEPHHTPSPKAQQTSSTSPSSPTLPSVTTAPIPTVTPSDTPTLRSRQGNIVKSSTLPHDSTPRVTSHAANEGSMQLKLDELTGLCTSLQRKHSEMVAKFEAQELEINRSNLDEGKAVAERVSDDSEEMATVLTSMDAATVLASGVAEVPTGSGSIPTASPLATEVPTGSDVVPTAGPIFATATVVTPYTRRKGKETMVESKTPKKRKIARDAEVARIHAKEELQMMINSLDRSWKMKDFRGMTFEEIEAKFTLVCKQIKNFIPMGSKEEAERFKRKGIRFEQESAKKLKTSEEVLKEVKTSNENPKEKVKEMM
uniref:Uncharacterized protein n=1 Tax=Tanacetum cinerariifolium TaxID=118510 RepID=A0A699JG23_TANCI|nr:hypothetical protein [Tanacetum cinerariifolium]